MKQNKLVIAVLVVIAVLFVLGLSSSVFRDKDDKDDELSITKAENLQNGWVGSLDDAMAPFRRTLDRRRLAQRAKCQTGERSFKLTDEKECDIPIAAAIDGAEVENVIVAVEGDNVVVKVAYDSNETVSELTRGLRVSLDRIKTPKVVTGIGKLKPPRVQPGSSQPPIELTVVYFPEGKAKEPGKFMKVEGDLRLTVLAKGGTLRLKCKGCDPQKRSTIEVSLK